MKTETGKIKTVDGLSLYWKAWLPDGTPKAALQVIHGYAEHIDRYAFVVNELVPAGYALFGTDHRGHGRSDGRRAYVNSFQEFIDDQRQFRREVILKALPGVPSFVLGHSMGSLIAMNLVEQYPEGLHGLILSGTGSAPGPEIGKPILIATRVLSRILPKIHVKSPLPPEFISRDTDVVKAYIADPLVFDVITPRLAEQMNTYLAIGASNAGRIEVPVLIQFGSIDTSFSGQKELFDALGSADKTFKRYIGLKHEVYNELPPDRAKVLADLHTWLDAHV
ncbi:MAG TPA: lysophospholipase [Deltaproteobacteria bacterium]|nr:lysophospholipase [Deltaproteobacteria bacterium]HQI00077.1 lysophospholipase [Deltaproteobacteria bacterium]HQJ09381.1 lysophospholipase [Deltaproteobacteria bacterium]